MRRKQRTLSIALLVCGSFLCGMFVSSPGRADLLADSGEKERSATSTKRASPPLRMEEETTHEVAPSPLASEPPAVGTTPVVSKVSLPDSKIEAQKKRLLKRLQRTRRKLLLKRLLQKRMQGGRERERILAKPVDPLGSVTAE